MLPTLSKLKFIELEYRRLRTSFNQITSCWLLFIFFISSDVLIADSRQIIEYGYDASGNLTDISPEDSNSPPNITQGVPESISLSGNADFIMTGNGLRNASVTSTTNGIDITVLSSTNNAINLHVALGPNVPLGTHSLIVTTSLGSTTVAIQVLPSVAVYPEIVALSLNHLQALALNLSAANNVARTINLQIEDPAIATVTPATITLQAGLSHYAGDITVTGHSLGHTQLAISSPDITATSIPIFIAPSHNLPFGDYRQYSQPLGIVYEGAPSPDLLLNGPFITQLRIQKGNIDVLDNEQPKTTYSTQLGIVRGTFVSALSHESILAGSDEVVITLTGSGLFNVDDVKISPADGITIGALTISATGDQISFPVSISPDQAIGAYQIQLMSSGEPIQTVLTSADIFYVTKGAPVLSYIDPILVTRDSFLSIEIAGSNFDFVKNIRIEPQDGITLASDFIVNDAGTHISQIINVDISAPLGDRVVIVETVAGESSQEPAENNTLSISNGPGSDISEIMSATVGVIKQQTLVTNEQILDIRTHQLGVVIGDYINGLMPSQATVGSMVTVNVFGVGLDKVIDVDLLPIDGISLSNLNIASDGLSLSFDLSIDSNAPLIPRQILLTTETEAFIPAVSVDADRFDVIAVQPEVKSVYPQHIAVNVAAIPVSVTGSDLNNTTVVRFEPANGLSVDSFTVAQDGRLLDMLVSISADASLGTRLLIVETTAGQSSEIASIANTLTIADAVSTISTLLSAQIGIQKGTDELPVDELTGLLISPMLGVVRQFAAPPDNDSVALFSPALGLTVGPMATRIFPDSLSIGKTANLVISGVGLDQVTNANFEPAEGITITGVINSNNNGEQLIIPVQIATDAEQSLRELLLTTGNDSIRFAPHNQGQLLISGLTPEIVSLDPIQQTQGASFTLLIRGVNLEDTQRVSASPSTGISFGPPSINIGGTEMTITMIISPTASPGARVMTVTTPAGSTESSAIPANTFTIIN